MASPQPTDSHTRISNELYTQILMRDFTKRQRAILDLIIRLSYGCGKKTAYIPSQKYFEICGVHQKKVSAELRSLQKIHVISWDNISKQYWLIKNYDVWDIKPIFEHANLMFDELLKANLKNHQNGGTYHQNGGGLHQNGDKENTDYHQNGGDRTTKTVVISPPKRWRIKSETSSVARLGEVPITKDNYKDIKNIKEKKKNEIRKKLVTYFPFGISAASEYDINEYMDKIEDLELLDAAYKESQNIPNIRFRDKFIVSTLRRFLNEGITTIAQYELRESEKQIAISRRGGKENVRNVDERHSAETDEEWEAMERNFFAGRKHDL